MFSRINTWTAGHALFSRNNTNVFLQPRKQNVLALIKLIFPENNYRNFP